jgi:hypothetical protein
VALNFGVAGAVTAGFIIKTAIVIGAAAYSRRQQRKARAAALDSIRDRTFMVRTGTEDRPIVYGRTRLSGPFRPLGTHGPDGERFSFTVSLAGPLDAVEAVWFGDESIGTLDANGWTTDETYYRSSVPPALFYEAVSGSYTVTLPHLATSITSIWIGSSFDHDGGTQFHLGDPVTDTLAYSSATVGGVTVITFNAAQVGRTVVVNYSYASGQSFARAQDFLGQAGQAARPEEPPDDEPTAQADKEKQPEKAEFSFSASFEKTLDAIERQKAVDSIANFTDGELQAQVENLVAPVISLIESSNSYAEVADKMLTIWPQMDSSRVEDVLLRAVFTAGVAGRIKEPANG